MVIAKVANCRTVLLRGRGRSRRARGADLEAAVLRLLRLGETLQKPLALDTVREEVSTQPKNMLRRSSRAVAPSCGTWRSLTRARAGGCNSSELLDTSSGLRETLVEGNASKVCSGDFARRVAPSPSLFRMHPRVRES